MHDGYMVETFQDCAKKSVAVKLGANKRLKEDSRLVCPICRSPSPVKDAFEKSRCTQNEKYEFRQPILNDVKFKRNYFLEKCIQCYFQNERFDRTTPTILICCFLCYF